MNNHIKPLPNGDFEVMPENWDPYSDLPNPNHYRKRKVIIKGVIRFSNQYEEKWDMEYEGEQQVEEVIGYVRRAFPELQIRSVEEVV